MKKIALVTASTRGIGWAIAVSLAKQGMKVYVSSIEQELEAAKVKIEKCNSEGKEIIPVAYNAYEDLSYKKLIDTVIENEGRLDILVNNFGVTDVEKDLSIDRIQYEDFEKIVNLNIKSVMLPIMYALPAMKKNGGSIINIASIGGKVPDMTEMAYGTAKAAICHITKMAATQLAVYKIRCNAILPGIVATDAVKEALSPEYQAFFLRHVPLSRMAEPEEIGEAAVFLANSEYTTGQLLEVAGGFGTATPMYADIMEMAIKMQK